MKKITLLLSVVFVASCSTNSKNSEDQASSNSGGYQGHGSGAVSAEKLQKFAAGPLEPNLSRKIQSYLDVRSPGGGMLSHDKNSLYFSWRVTGVSQVWKLTGPKAFPIQMTGGEDVTNLAGLTNDGKYLIISRDRNGEEYPGIYLQNTNGGALQLVQHKEKVQSIPEFVSEDSNWLYYRANDIKPDSYTVYRYNIKKKINEIVFSQNGYWGISDYQNDGRLLLSKAVSNVASEIYEWQPQERFLKPLFGQNEKEEFEVKYGTEPGQYFVLTNKFSEFRKLYTWSKNEFKAVSGDLKWDVAGFHIDRARKHILYTVNEGGYTRIFALDAKTLRKIKLPDFPKADHVDVVSMTDDGEDVMLSIGFGNQPRTSFQYTWKTGKLTQWVIPSQPELDLSKVALTELSSYQTRDGVKIPMLVRRPAACAKKVCPVVVHFHGGPEAQSFAGFNLLAQLFVEEGFIFVEPNVRGSDGYGKTWLHSDDGPKRLDVITDIEDAAIWIRKNWGVTKIGVMGWSYGGYSTLVAQTKFGGSYDAGVALVGMSHLVTFIQNTAPYRRALRIPEYGDPAIPAEKEAMEKLSPLNYLDNVKTPLMIIQGATDPRVPAGEAIQIHESLQKKSIPSSLIIFADEGHGTQKRQNKVLELGHTIQFFKTHLLLHPSTASQK